MSLVNRRAETSRSFEAATDSPRRARHFVSDVLADAGIDDRFEDASLVVTELATNAVVHARSDFTVAVQVQDGYISISVTDGTPDLTSAANEPGDRNGGRGLRIVSVLADQCGVERAGTGKRVWARLGPTSGTPAHV